MTALCSECRENADDVAKLLGVDDMLRRAVIAVLDGFALNPGDLSWERLSQLGEYNVHDRSTPKEVLDRAQQADAVLINKVPLNEETIAALPRLSYIGVSATGYNVVDVAAARARGITVTNVPIYGTDSVAQMVFAHLLNLTQNVAGHAAAVRSGRWTGAIDWCFWDTPLLELQGMTMGIVGLGRIGRATARIAQAFGMNVIAFSRSHGTKSSSIERVSLDMLFRTSDVVSLHCPLNAESENLVNRARLAVMKPTALLINTSRGQLVDEAALAEALNDSRIAGAGLDVLAAEPPLPTNPLLTARNCFITPHIAWATHASRSRLLETTINNLAAFLKGAPVNVVS